MSMSIDQRIRMYDEKFSRVAFPLRPLHYDTKVALDLLLHKHHFLDICRLAFGPLQLSTATPNASGANNIDAGVYWMDEANSNPDGKLALDIYNFFAPGGNFHNIMEQLSVPSSNFHASLRKQWKDQVDVAGSGGKQNNKHSTGVDDAVGDGGVHMKRFDFPLAALCSYSRMVVAESRDVDLASLPRSRVPPLMLVPFWFPPLVTREEPTTRQPHNSLPCSVLGYFLLRLMHFVSFRCGNDSRAILSDASADVPLWRQRFDDWLSRLVGDPQRKISRAFPVVTRLLFAYHAYYAKHGSIVGRMQLCMSLEEVGWDLGGTMWQLLLHGPVGLWLRRLPQVQLEAHRQPITDPGSLAGLTVLVPYLAEMAERWLPQAWSNNAVGSSLTTAPATPSGEQSCASDILRPMESLYRSCLVALRYAAMSYPRIPRCKPIHYEQLFRLWRAVVASCQSATGSDGGIGPSGTAISREGAVLQRYEALTFALGDIVAMLANSACVGAMNDATAKHFFATLCVYRVDTVSRVLADASQHIQAAGSLATLAPGAPPPQGRHQSTAFVHYLRTQFALQWQRSDGAVLVPDLHGPELRMQVARAVMALWRRADPTCQRLLGSTDAALAPLPTTVASVLMECADLMLEIVPQAKADAEALKREFANAPAARTVVDCSSSNGSSASTLADISPSNVQFLGVGSSISVSNSAWSIGGVVSAQERQRFLDGHIGTCHALHAASELTFATRQNGGGVRGTLSVTQPILRSDEFPPLVAVSLLLDDVVELVQTLVRWKLVPRCHRGHLLWLIEDVGRRCSQHHQQNALWECHTCGVTFCDTCKRCPVDPDNRLQLLIPMLPSEAQRYTCTQCHLVFPDRASLRGFSNTAASGASGIGEDASFYCAHCASRPFRPISTRIIAAYSTWWTMVGLALLASIVWMLLRP